MINNFEPFEKFIDSITERTPLLKTAQLKVMVYLYFKDTESDITPDLAEMIIFACQRKGKLLLTSDGWAMTKGQYKRLLCNHAEEKIDTKSTYRLGPMNDKCKDFCPEIIALMWIVAYNMPKSYNYTIGTAPYYINYIPVDNNSSNSKLYQFTYIKAGEEIPNNQLLKTLPKISDDFKPSIRRFALLQSDKKIEFVPYVGFSDILVVDDTKENHVRLVEQRDKDIRWKDNG